VALGKPEAAGVPEGFLERGGSLLAATDGASDAFGQLGVRFLAGPVIVDGPPGPPDCPVTGGFARTHELFAGVRQVSFNRAGYLDLSAAGTVQKLAWFPDEARVNDAPAPFLTAIGATLDSRRALFVSDQSVFINEMFLDANRRPLNARFCANVVDWLVGGRDPAELKVLFLEDGEAIGEWIDPRYLEGRWPQNPLEEKLDFFDELMKAMEKYVLDLEKRIDPDTKLPLFEQWMQNLENRAAPGTYIRWAILAASMLLAFVVARWMLQWSPIRAKTLKEPKPPIEAKPHFLERRRRELLEGGHYVELARRMSRMWLERRFGGSASAGAPARNRIRRRVLAASRGPPHLAESAGPRRGEAGGPADLPGVRAVPHGDGRPDAVAAEEAGGFGDRGSPAVLKGLPRLSHQSPALQPVVLAQVEDLQLFGLVGAVDEHLPHVPKLGEVVRRRRGGPPREVVEQLAKRGGGGVEAFQQRVESLAISLGERGKRVER